MEYLNELKLVRVANGMSILAASRIMGIAVNTYKSYEKNPELVPVGKLFKFYAELDDDSQIVLDGFIAKLKNFKTI